MNTKGKREVITQKSKKASSKALMSSLWCTRTHKAVLFQALCTQKADSMHGQETSRRRPRGAQAKGGSEGHLISDVMEILKNISLCLASFTPRFESFVGRIPPSKAHN